jgi:SulP family sulfate permease
MPALAGLLILAGFGALKPRQLARSWQTSKSSGAAALLTMIATLLVPIHIAVLIGVILSLILVGINSSSAANVVALQPIAPGRWRRGEVPPSLPPGHVTVLDIEGSGAFTSVPGLFAALPQPPQADPGSGPAGPPPAVVLRLRGHLRTNLTFTKALADYAAAISASGGTVVVCGLQPATIAQLRSAGLPESVALLPQGTELDGALADAYDRATTWLATAAGPATGEPQPPEESQA